MRRLTVTTLAFSLCLFGADALAGTCACGGGIDEYTVLMLHCNGEEGSTGFPDDSFSNHPVTAHGSAHVDTVLKKFGTGACTLPASGDYLTIPDHDDWILGTTWTIDYWAYLTAYGYAIVHYGQDGSHYNTWTYFDDGVRVQVGAAHGDLNIWRATGANIQLHTWYHIAIVQNGTSEGDFHIFINGVGQDLEILYDGSWANMSMPDQTDQLYIGQLGPHSQYYFTGAIDELRVSKGVARWTSDFTPPDREYSRYVCADVPLTDHWNLVGYIDLDAQPCLLADCCVSDGVEVKAWAEAVVAGWVDPILYYYIDELGYRVLRAEGTADDDSFRSGRGYWLLNTSGHELTLSVPQP